jgi:hypothetical protein
MMQGGDHASKPDEKSDWYDSDQSIATRDQENAISDNLSRLAHSSLKHSHVVVPSASTRDGPDHLIHTARLNGHLDSCAHLQTSGEKDEMYGRRSALPSSSAKTPHVTAAKTGEDPRQGNDALKTAKNASDAEEQKCSSELGAAGPHVRFLKLSSESRDPSHAGAGKAAPQAQTASQVLPKVPSEAGEESPEEVSSLNWSFGASCENESLRGEREAGWLKWTHAFLY